MGRLEVEVDAVEEDMVLRENEREGKMVGLGRRRVMKRNEDGRRRRWVGKRNESGEGRLVSGFFFFAFERKGIEMGVEEVEEKVDAG